MLVKEQSSRRLIAVGTVVADRVIGLVALLVTGSLTGLFPTELRQRMPKIMATYHLGGLGGLAAIALLMMPAVTGNPLVRSIPRLPVVGKLCGQLIDALTLYQSRWRMVAFVMLLSIAGHFAMLWSFYCCALAIHPPDDIPSFAEHLQLVPAAELTGVIIPSPGGVGALEWRWDISTSWRGSRKGTAS